MAMIQPGKLKEVIKQSNVTYSVLTYSTEYLDRKTQRLALRHAFDIITEIINVDFIEVANTSDVVIQIQYGVDLGKLRYRSGVIAYCEKDQTAPGTNSSEYKPLLDEGGKYIVPRISKHDIFNFRAEYAPRTNNFPCTRAGMCRDLHTEKLEEEELGRKEEVCNTDKSWDGQGLSAVKMGRTRVVRSQDGHRVGR
uniref:Uncharacterized protein n=1 Tax=Acrobeloides nanus TaxID=290746 RepID=A0A914BUH4_9BILA